MAFDRAICAITIYCEASNSTGFERRCVMRVIKKRATIGTVGTTVSQVCLRRMQFSEWNADKIDNANLMRAAKVPDDDPIMLDCAAAFDEVMDGATPDPTKGATHYVDRTIPPPYWATGATIALETRDFVFYSGVA